MTKTEDGTALGLFSCGLRRLDCLQKPGQLRGGLVLRDRLQLLECTGEGVRQAPHGSRLKLFVHRLKVQVVDSSRQMLGKPGFFLNECLVDQQLGRSCG